MPRRSPTGSLAVPMSMPRYSCMASALTISAGRPRAASASARSRDSAVLPVPVAPTRAQRAGAAVTRSDADAERGKAQRHRARGAGLGARRGDGARLGERTVVSVAGTRATDAQGGAVGRIREQVEGGRMRHRDAHDVAGARDVGAGRHLEVDEPVIFGASGEAVGRGILLALAGRDEHLQLATDLPAVLCERDALLELDEAVVALLDDGLGHLALHRRGGGALADRVLEGEGAREAGCLDDAHRIFEVLVGL